MVEQLLASFFHPILHRSLADVGLKIPRMEQISNPTLPCQRPVSCQVVDVIGNELNSDL